MLILKETVGAKCPGVMSKISLCHLNGSMSQQAHMRHKEGQVPGFHPAGTKILATAAFLKLMNNELIAIKKLFSHSLYVVMKGNFTVINPFLKSFFFF